ncbi:variant surface glycoprotein (VSG), putative [Trypanosoma vivax Y486]|uniref:Variant surface glycoprotein (VSG), putative n=1 Tax=Trypanosoma vivax (strain Y486) TaxID=1055687 RepID=F9WMD3_TRYVY|nr:variant surface glycoprotein (VSG), putative [Trypanosoma vivax Y486]|eukprot:CCD18686.1 variant surface glycoprotein (VSG), putative [Trypanosoma vivax Y486]
MTFRHEKEGRKMTRLLCGVAVVLVVALGFAEFAEGAAGDNEHDYAALCGALREAEAVRGMAQDILREAAVCGGISDSEECDTTAWNGTEGAVKGALKQTLLRLFPEAAEQVSLALKTLDEEQGKGLGAPDIGKKRAMMAARRALQLKEKARRLATQARQEAEAALWGNDGKEPEGSDAGKVLTAAAAIAKAGDNKARESGCGRATGSDLFLSKDHAGLTIAKDTVYLCSLQQSQECQASGLQTKMDLDQLEGKGTTDEDGKKAVDNWKKIRANCLANSHASRTSGAAIEDALRRVLQRIAIDASGSDAAQTCLGKTASAVNYEKYIAKDSTTGTIKNTTASGIPWMAALRAAGHSIDAAQDAAMRSEDAWHQAWHETQLAAEAQKEQEDTAAENANKTNTDNANDVTAPTSEAQGKHTHGKGNQPHEGTRTGRAAGQGTHLEKSNEARERTMRPYTNAGHALRACLVANMLAQ